MTNLLCFDFNDQAVRVVLIDGEPWWVAADICAILGLTNVSHAMSRLDDDQVTLTQNEGTANRNPLNVVSESGLWTLVLRSDKPQAVAIRRWLTSEVLPTLRRTGTYTMPSIEDAPGAQPVIDLGRYRLDLDAVALYRRLAGNGAALALWAHLGLPVPPSPGTGPAIADGLVEALASWIDGPPPRDRFTYADIGHGLGIGPPDHLTKRRIHDVLAAQGWIYKNMKFGKQQRWAWKAPDPGPVTWPVTAGEGDAA